MFWGLGEWYEVRNLGVGSDTVEGIRTGMFWQGFVRRRLVELVRERLSGPGLESWVVWSAVAIAQAGTNVKEGEVPLRIKYRRCLSGGRAGIGIAGEMRSR